MPGTNHRIDCYGVLGLKPPADQVSPASSNTSIKSLLSPTPDEVRIRYIQLVREKHPDRPIVQDAFDELENVLALELQGSLNNPQATQNKKKRKIDPELRPKDEVEEFAKIHFAFETLTNPRKRYIYNFPSAGYYEIKLPGRKKKKHKSMLRRQELWDAIYNASIKERIQAFFASVLYGLTIATLSLVLIPIAPVVTLLSLIPLWLAPSFVPKQVAHYYGLDPDEASILTKLFITLITPFALPFVAIAMLPIAMYTGAVTGRHAYKEMAARGMSENQKIAVAMGVIALTVGLLILFPPAGLVTLLSTGGWVAATLGMANFTLPMFAAAAAGAAAGAVAAAGIFMKVCRGIANCFKKTCCPNPPYPSLAELEERQLYQPESIAGSLAAGSAGEVPSPPEQSSPAYMRDRLGVSAENKTADTKPAQQPAMRRDNSDSQLSSKCSSKSSTLEFVEDGSESEDDAEKSPVAALRQ